MVAEAERVIREGSKSFRFSSNLFDQATRERAWLLYAWCRACDDLADGQTLGSAPTALGGRDRPGKAAGQESAAGRAGQPGQGARRPQPPSPADRAAAGCLLPPGLRRFVGHNGVSIAPSSLLARRQNSARHDRLAPWERTLSHGAVAPADPQRRITFIREATDRALAGETVGLAPFDALRVVAAECGIPRRFIDDHLAGFALDADGWQPRTEQDLLRYCYHVAGAVGCMMAVVMGVPPDEDEVLDRAADLGIAFQLANISRDMIEDHEVGRRYLPAEWLDAGGVDPTDRRALAAIAARLAALVADYEASARVGADRLPFRSRWAVLAAANIYGAIARKVVARGEGAWDSRTVVHKPAKLLFLLKALGQCAVSAPPSDRNGLWSRPRDEASAA